jgi:predicted extracellular nuclease/2',3'-cyclic-nucleotide 2'-phosphodiesterase (5'-nucleotidase family)
MPHTRSPRRARLAAILSVALALTGLQLFFTAPAAHAASGTVVISEIFGANSATNLYNQDFVELHNPTGSPVSIDGMSVQYRSATSGTGASSGVNLSGSIAAGGYYLVGGAVTAGGASIPTPDASNPSMNLSGTNGVVILANTTTSTLLTNAQIGAGPSITGTPGSNALIQDLVGYGTTPDRYETGLAPAPSNTTTIRRTAADGDNNTSEFSTSATGDPTNGTPVDPNVTVEAPGNKAGIVGIPITPFDLTATGGTPPYTWAKVGMPPGITLDPDGTVAGTPTTAGNYDPVVEVTDSAAPTASDTDTFSFDIAANPSLSSIADVQGTGATTPLNGQLVEVEGEVTASYPTGGLNGFYIQTPGADATPNASDGIFVYGGTGGFPAYPAIGDSVSVIGTAGEFSGQTQITAADGGVSTIADLPGDVVAKTQIPGAGCALPGTGCDGFPALNAAREIYEGEALQPAGDYTVTDVYDFAPFIAFDGGTSNSSSMFGEIALAANSNTPLVTPTEIIDAQATAAKNKRIAYNNAHRIVLDDGSSLSYNQAANTGSPFPWLTASHHVRVGAAVTFPEPVIFTFGFNTWRLLPSSRVVGEPTVSQPQFEQTRADNLAPEDVGGDLKLATFNVLNFFPTTGNEYVTSALGLCTYFTDRQGNQITNNRCGSPAAADGNGPRGAANEINLERQRDKIVAAINTADADIVSLEELENSEKFGKSRDFAIDALVTALNADAGPGTWAAVPSPAASGLPPLSEQDVIRNGFIYKPAAVALVGGSVVLADQSSAGEAFEDAREPLAQAFKRVGTSDIDAFAVIVNHFKSKGSGTPDPDGQGNANDSRILQANALATFADSFKAQRGISRVYLTGDFNSYSEEDPIQVLEAAGYTNLGSTFDSSEKSYNFDGQMGSLDHVLANPAALADVADVDMWEINANESVYYEYSRFNYNVTNLYDDGPFRSSDHNPELVGINTPEPGATTEIQILGTNDFHGRIANDPFSAAAGAGVMAGAVKQLRAAKPNTVFAAAGDLIGASTFESFILNDKPTIDALNEAGLEVSAAGNHEFDQGYDDLVNRVMADYHATDNPDGGAEWEYIAANVRLDVDDSRALAPTWTQQFGDIKVGFVGAVTEHLPELVSPGGIEEIYVTDVVDEVNDAADDLKADGADIVVMLVHEGAPNTNCTDIAALGPATDFGSIVQGVNANVDAIVSGHTHLEYNCSFPVPTWVTQGRAVTERPVVSAGQYGAALNRIVFTVDSSTGEVVAKTQSVLRLKSCSNSTACTNYPVDAPTQVIVDEAVADSAVLGAVPLGEIAGPIRRGYLANGTTENRGVESALGNVVAEAQRWQTSGPEAGGAQIAFMNPGGLRADMLGNGANYPKTLTYKQAAEVQPFANGLVNMDLTGAQIKSALEQQWQPTGASRPFLKLGSSAGFTYTSDPDAAQGSRITGMWLDGVAINPATVYSVTVNGFLATGGDNFGAFAGGQNKAEAGLTDLQAMVNYMDEFANTGEGDDPLPVPTEQGGVHVNFPPAAPATYEPGDTVTFDVSGWSFSTAGDAKDTDVVVMLGATTLGTFPLDNAIQAALPGFDGTGTTSVSVDVPAGTPDGPATLLLTGATTGTEIPVIVTVDAAEPVEPVEPVLTVSAPTMTYGKSSVVTVNVSATGQTPTGTVQVKNGATVLGTGTVSAGTASITLPARSLAPGTTALTAVYSGDANVATKTQGFNQTVAKATPTVSFTVKPATIEAGQTKATIRVKVVADGVVPVDGEVKIFVKGQGNQTVTLVNGKAKLKLDVFKNAGKRNVRVTFLGSDFVETAKEKGSLTVIP